VILAGFLPGGLEEPCNCLGNLTDPLHISPQLADNIMKVVLSYPLIGSYRLLFWEWHARRQLTAQADNDLPSTLDSAGS
jgi:hypothetical protein